MRDHKPAPHVARAVAQARLAPGGNAVPAGGIARHVQAAMAAPGRAGRCPPCGARNAGSAAVQPFAWGILASGAEDDPEIVRENLRNASRYSERVELTTDPEAIPDPVRRNLGNGEILHLHGHGAVDRLGGFGANTLATQVLRKFHVNSLRGRTILLHSCEVGQGDFLDNFLTALRAQGGGGGGTWNGTTVFGPSRFLVVNEDGISMVARAGVLENQLATRASQTENVEKKGIGWVGRTIRNGAIVPVPANQVQALVIHSMKREGRGEIKEF